MATELAQLAGRLELDVLSDGRPANPVVVLLLDRWRDAPPSLIDRAAGLPWRTLDLDEHSNAIRSGLRAGTLP